MFETAYKASEKAHKNRGLHQKVYGEMNMNTENNNYESNNSYNEKNNMSNYNYSDMNANDSEMRQSELNTNTNKITNLKEEDEEYEDKFDDI